MIMKSFDPIDILFMSLIGFYLVVLVVFIVIFVKLSKKYDNNGNKLNGEDDILITEMNEYSNEFLIWFKNTINKIKKFIYEKLPKKEEVKVIEEKPKPVIKEKVTEMKSMNDLILDKEDKKVVKKPTPKKSTSTTKKPSTAAKKPNTSTKKKSTTSTNNKPATKKKSTTSSSTKKATPKKASTDTNKKPSTKK